MVDYIASRPFGFVFIVTAHVVFNGHSQAEVTGALGSNIILEFTFNLTNTSITSAGLYRVDTFHTEKIHECPLDDNCSESHVCVFNAASASALYCITNLRRNNSGIYRASVFKPRGQPVVNSNLVSLAVRQENTSSTVPPTRTNSTGTNGGGSFPPKEFPLYGLLVFVFLGVSVVALLAGWLSWFARRHKRTKEQQQQDPTPTVQETAEASGRVPACSLVYSVLDFPKRPQSGVEVQPTDTEYAAITYSPKHSVT